MNEKTKRLTAGIVAAALLATGMVMQPALTTGAAPYQASEKSEWVEDFVEGSSILQDYGYEKGELKKSGWKSTFLDMAYIPEDDIKMGLEQDGKLMEYYERNGTDRMVASSEMVALGKNGSYIQLMTEVNPNEESASDILGRFVNDEELEKTTKPKMRKIAGKEFLVCRGKQSDMKCTLGVSTDKKGVVIAFKTAYGSKEEKKLLLKGFSKMMPPNIVDKRD